MKDNHKFYVVSDLCADLIIGTDFLFKHECVLNFSKNSLCSPKIGTVTFFQNERTSDAFLLEHVILQPFSSSVVSFICPQFSPGSTICFSPNNCSDSLFVSPCLSIMQSDHTFYSTLSNTSAFVKAIKTNMCLGTVSLCPEIQTDFNVCSVSYNNNAIETVFNINEIALPEMKRMI